MKLTALLALLLQTVSGSAAQDPVTFTRDAAGVFARISSQGAIGFLGMKESFEGTVKQEGLSRADGAEEWSRWEGENASGRIAVHGSFPALLDRANNRFWILFQPGTETNAVLSEAMLAHLLAKADKTSIATGDALDLEMPSESLLGGCIVSQALRIRMTGAELVSTSATFTCPVRKK